jgi:hypothetical protein
MKFLKTWLTLKLCFLLAFPINVWPQAQPVAQPDRVNRAVSGVLQDGMRSRGFAANDPRFGNTIARATPYLAGIAGTGAAVVAGTVTAPAWVSAALVIGVGTIVSYAVNLALDSLIKWYFRADKLLDESSDSSQSTSSCVMTSGGPYWTTTVLGKTFIGCDPDAVARQAYSYYAPSNPSAPTQPAYCLSSGANSYSCAGITATRYINGAPQSCPGGTYSNGTQCLGYTYTINEVAPATAVSPQTAISHIPAADLNKQLNPSIIAAVANRTWQQAAAQPGYDGLPYPVANPITPAEVIVWTTANPTIAPTIRDFTAPNPVTTVNPQPWALPASPTATQPVAATTPNANTVNPAAANTLQNLGADPAIPQPNLEPTPTAQSIFQPFLDLVQPILHFNFNAPSGTCPRPVFDVFGKPVAMNAHCDIAENNRPALTAIMGAVYTIIALFIIFSA